MLFETKDSDWIQWMQILMKRIKSFPKINNDLDKIHPLYIKWMNMKLIIDAAKVESVDHFYTESIIYLTLLSKEVEHFSKENMLSDDNTVRCILAEASSYMFFDPMKLQVEQ